LSLSVVHIIATLTTGGAERQLELLVASSAHQATTWCLFAEGPVADSMRAAGRRVQLLGTSGWRKPLSIPRLALRLRRHRPDVVHVHLLSGQLWGIPAARLAGVPVVVSTEHSLMEDTIEGRPHTWWLRLLYRVLERLATHTIAVSATTAERLQAWNVSAGRVSVVENGVDFQALRYDPVARAAVRAELGIADDVVVIGAVGRLDPVKRIDEVIAAAAPELSRGGHLLLVAGTGPQQPELAEHADLLGVAEQVRFLGGRTDVPRLLCAMDVLVSASRDETFGLAVIEALGSGLPVVYVQCPALDELLERPTWAVRSTGAELGADLAALLGALGRRPVPAELVDRYDVRTTAARVDMLYERLLAQHAVERARR